MLAGTSSTTLGLGSSTCVLNHRPLQLSISADQPYPIAPFVLAWSASAVGRPLHPINKPTWLGLAGPRRQLPDHVLVAPFATRVVVRLSTINHMISDDGILTPSLTPHPYFPRILLTVMETCSVHLH